MAVFMGIMPSGKAVGVQGMDFYRLYNARIVEHRHKRR
jgi:hypothetical protein